MAENLTLDVNINPAGQPSPTSSNIALDSPTSATNIRERNISLLGVAKLAIGASALKSVGGTALGLVGDWTGNRQLQRDIDAGLTVLGYGTQIAIGGLIGVGAVAAQITSKALSQNVRLRNINLNADYQSTLRGNRYFGNR